MYTAIGVKTNKPYLEAETKSDLMRELSEDYQWQMGKQCIYPEPLRIENSNKYINDLDNLSEKERKKVLLNNSEKEEISQFFRKKSKGNDVPRKRNDSRNVQVKCTIPNGEILMFGSISDTARYFGIQASTVKTNMDNETTDSKGNFYERMTVNNDS